MIIISILLVIISGLIATILFMLATYKEEIYKNIEVKNEKGKKNK